MSKQSIKETWLDNAISWISPQAGVRRMHARLIQENARIQFRGYEGASKGRRLGGWNPPPSSANSETRVSLKALRSRSRDLCRNEAYAIRAVNTIVTNVIGEGFLAKAKAKTEGRSKIFQVEWLDWAQSLDCDFDGLNTFAALQALVMRTIVESGEVLVRRVRRDSTSGLSVPMQLQILEPDFLDDSKDGEVFSDGSFNIQGIEFSKEGKRKAYWLFQKHPGDTYGGITLQGVNSVRVPAEEVLHIFRVERAGQVRGVPWLAPVMLKIKDLSDYSDFTLVRQKVSACFTAFVTAPDSLDLKVGSSAQTPAIGAKLEPGVTEQLPPGYSVEFASPPTSGDFSQFSNAQLRALSAGMGITFETLTNDYSNCTFSSGRMGWQEFQRHIDQWRAHLITPRFCIPVWRWFTETAGIAGFGSDKVVAIWTAPKREMIDPTKEVEALKSEVRSGLKSLPEAIRQNGYEPSEVFNEIAETNKELDRLKLILETDPRQDIGVEKAKAEEAPKTGKEKPKKEDS